MESSLAQEAISAALSCNWEKAIEINSRILKDKPQDIDALNRVARAYAESGSIEKAKEITQKVLYLDPANTIAEKCLVKWNSLKKGGNGMSTGKISKFTFIEEPTKTKVVELINLGETTTLLGLDCGDIVQLMPHPHRVSVVTSD